MQKVKLIKNNNYAFIDSQNLNLGVKSQQWKLDWKKFRQYLNNKYQIKKAFLFIGYIQENQKLYDFLKNSGFDLIFKPTIIKKHGTKGNVDAELVLHSMIQYEYYDKAVIVSGDGDFYCLIEYLDKNEKLLKVLAPTSHYSSLLRGFNNKNYIVRIDLLRDSLEQKKTGIRVRSKP